jgi:DNA-directed RNA polymerase specialized sigma24 family protein
VRMLETGSASAAPDSPDEFAEWVRPQLVLMARLASRLAPADDSDDIVQEALVRAWTKRRQFDPSRGTPGTWLLAITADQARQARRRRPTPLAVDTAGRHAYERRAASTSSVMNARRRSSRARASNGASGVPASEIG